MVLEKLGDSLRAALRKIAGASYVDESLIKEIVRDIQRALIQADVNVQLSLSITQELHRRAREETPPPGMSPREHVVRIIYEELVRILGASRDVPLQKQRILLVGLYGQGKTTTAGKLAKYFQKKGLSGGQGRGQDRPGRRQGARGHRRDRRRLVRAARARAGPDQGDRVGGQGRPGGRTA